jgi:hypothetical protein
MLVIRRMGFALGLSLAAGVLGLSAAPQTAGARTSPFLGPVPPPVCQPGDRTEQGVDGQLTQGERDSGASTKPYNCNLAIVGEYAGQGAGHQLMWYDHCAYVTTEGFEAGQKGVPPLLHPGIQVLDVTSESDPKYVTNLDGPAALYDWEDGAVSAGRELLGTAESWWGSGPQPAVAFYDLSDCAHPRLLASVQLPDPNLLPHGGNFAFDGKTYWIASMENARLAAVDVSDPSHPKELINWDFPQDQAGGAGAQQMCHRISLNQFTVDGHPPGSLLFCGVIGKLISPGVFSSGDGVVIYDVSQVQDRRPNPVIKVVSSFYWKNGDIAIQPDLAFIHGKPFLGAGDEYGAGGGNFPKAAIDACGAGLPPFGFERLIDISHVARPKLVAQLMIGVDDPKNCARTEHDITATMGSYGYSLHDCTFDNPRDAKLLACSGHQAGVRVFDIHDPHRPREIAYFVGPAPPNPNEIDAGSLMNAFQRITPPINFAWSKAHSRFVWENGQLYLWVTSSHGGFYTLKFENRQEIAKLQPVPTPGNEDYQD